MPTFLLNFTDADDVIFEELRLYLNFFFFFLLFTFIPYGNERQEVENNYDRNNRLREMNNEKL